MKFGAVLQRLQNIYPQEGLEKILDPFAGSGSTLQAARLE